MGDVSSISFRKKIALGLHRKYKKNVTKMHELNYLFWECTLDCNLNCLHCRNQYRPKQKVKDMPIPDLLKVVDEIKDIVTPAKTMIAFTGGEPLLRNDLEHCGKELYERGFPWGIRTNGLLLDKRRLKSLLSCGLRAITLNLEGLKESHNWLRNYHKAYQYAIRTIKLLKEVPDLVFDVVTCINKRNFLELDDLKELLINNGVKNWRIISIVPADKKKVHPDLILSPIQFKSLFEFIKKTKKERMINLNYGCQGFLGSYEGEVRDSFFFCRAGINIASILADGTISGCPNLNQNFDQGNIYTDNFKETWKNKFSLFRNKEWTKKGECKICKWYPYCEGNSMHLYDGNDNKLLFCHMKNIIAGQAFI